MTRARPNQARLDAERAAKPAGGASNASVFAGAATNMFAP